MNPETLSEKVLGTFRKVFPNQKQIDSGTTANDIVNWDSLNHITLILELEKEFGIRFDLFEFIELQDVRGIVEYISSKLDT
jgi:acyl carrier protein